MEREVRRSGEARTLWPGFELRYNGRTGSVCVKAPSARQRDEEQDRLYGLINEMFAEARALQGGRSIWEQDGEAITEMLLDMLVDSDAEPFRHALIISDKTKTIHKQRELAGDILARFGGADDLAVAVYNCSDGVRVGFSRGTHARRDILHDAYEATRRAEGALQREKERSGLGGGQGAGGARAGGVAVSGDHLVISNLPIGVMYEGLKGLCSRVVVISGEIGGRGVAYHDLQHERILTDMYAAQEVFADATVPQHGELLNQVLPVGRGPGVSRMTEAILSPKCWLRP